MTKRRLSCSGGPVFGVRLLALRRAMFSRHTSTHYHTPRSKTYKISFVLVRMASLRHSCTSICNRNL